MGKRLEDLDLDSTSGPGDSSATDAEDVAHWLGQIDDLLESEQYRWAEETLLGIHKTIEDSQRVTPGQARAIGNIEIGGQQHAREERIRGGSWRRRYEGYRR